MNVSKKTILTKGMTPDACLAAASAIIATDSDLSAFDGHLTRAMFSTDGMVGLGVPIGTDAFVQKFVESKCREIIDDVDKLDIITDGFIHYQLVRFCQATRLQHLNSHIIQRNRCTLQQQHVDVHITNALLKKGAGPDRGAWNDNHQAWARMMMHLPHAEGGFGVISSNITMNAAFYTSTSRFVAWLGTFSQAHQSLWLPTITLNDSSTWTPQHSPQLDLLRDIHTDLLHNCGCKETDDGADGGGVGAGGGGGAAANAGNSAGGAAAPAGGASSQQRRRDEDALSLPQLNCLHEAYLPREEDDTTIRIPSQRRLTDQLIAHWRPYVVLRQRLSGTRSEEQLRLRKPQKFKATVDDSVLRTEMGDLEPSDEDAPPRTLWHKPMAWLGVIRPLHKGEEWPLPLWQTFFSLAIGAHVPLIAAKPPAVCACKHFSIDAFGDHVCTCSSHSGAQKAHDWAVDRLADLFRTTCMAKTRGVAYSRGQQRGDIEFVGYLADAAGPRTLVADFQQTHERYGSSRQLHLNGTLHHPAPLNIDRPLQESASKKINAYRAEYANNHSISFIPLISSTSGRMHSELARLLFLQAHRETAKFFTATGRQAQSTSDASFRFRRAAFHSHLKSKAGLIVAKAAALRITLNIDGCPLPSRAHHHTSHSTTSRLLSTSLSHHLPLPLPHRT